MDQNVQFQGDPIGRLCSVSQRTPPAPLPKS